ncbi:carboxyvinyl-carboxyphosphonate phosphorylmutase [Marinobacterium mangrovicola]|uniref:Carboxyvinyl-carboxyphosphonate phosphorylmutase n=2 Tax=Marinobacterium mangrovicola TaxID=1476959 RepID=A0A4R1GMY3_9GAMM|nr:isocitrate lyase/phosphoenolpyruvate mutase family protein [Marinobacterium mangrovicola]TCK08543.1 carboxyvinyl-carboxyphosphonate phosphorylmutase [Marinobacterium mangrovicola]
MTTFLDSINDAKGYEVLASVHCPIAARMAVDLGFNYGMVGGSVASLSMLGTPDLMLLTSTELCDLVKRTSQSSSLNIIVDGDAGYGNALNTMRTVVELEMAGAKAVTLEDTKLPISYGQMKTQLISPKEQVDKLAAALDARSSESFGILARTQVVAGEEIGAVAERVHQYAETGVDGICLAGVTDQDQLEAISDASNKPKMLITYGKPNTLTDEIYERCNVKLLLSGHTPFEASIVATYQALSMLAGGTVSPDELNYKALIGKYTEQEGFDSAIKKYLNISE